MLAKNKRNTSQFLRPRGAGQASLSFVQEPGARSQSRRRRSPTSESGQANVKRSNALADATDVSDNSLNFNFGAVEQFVLQHKGPQGVPDQLGKMLDVISDYQDDEGFTPDDVIHNAPAYFDTDNIEDPLNLQLFFQEN